MREKLIELLEKYNSGLQGDKIADYLLNNGVVVLPCKIGSTVYLIRHDAKQIYECEVVRISIYGRENEIRCFTQGDGRYLSRQFADIGKTAFLTREEAERALKEKQR